jgi:uncharacterized iron-regulated protein
MPTLPFLLAALTLGGPVDTIPAGYTPHRVYDSHHKRWTDFESMAAELAKVDVIFLGEQHDDPSTHRMEAALLDAIARRRGNVVVALEMFERDVQPVLDEYLAGKIDEATFIKTSRPWPNYATDYRPLVEFAKAHGWHVVAGNIPRKMASAASSKGIGAISGLTDSTRRWAAAEFNCPKDDYFRRFGETMKQHPMGPGPAPTDAEMADMTEKFYQAQCAKDETMAESIAWVKKSAPNPPLVIHYNGAFHSDFTEGTAARTRRRLPDAKVAVISAIPVPSLDAIEPKPLRKQGDWLLFVYREADKK